MRGGEVAWFWSDRSSPPGRQAPTNTSQTGLRTRSGVINRLSVDWTGVVPRPQPNGRGHLTGAIGGTAGSASTFGARHGRVNSVRIRRNPGLGPIFCRSSSCRWCAETESGPTRNIGVPFQLL